MEPHKKLNYGIEAFKPNMDEGPIVYFKRASAFAYLFYDEEIKNISSTKWENVNEDFFFREYVWVVHATGFSAKAVGSFMGRLTEAYGHWSMMGNENFDSLFKRVKLVCNNPSKAKAIHKVGTLMGQVPWNEFKNKYLQNKEQLVKLPYIGPITCYHLGRNIGLLGYVKPDLHLVRMADYWGYKDCTEMCKSMKQETGSQLPLGIIDLILWYSASTFGTIDIKKDGR